MAALLLSSPFNGDTIAADADRSIRTTPGHTGRTRPDVTSPDGLVVKRPRLCDDSEDNKADKKGIQPSFPCVWLDPRTGGANPGPASPGQAMAPPTFQVDVPAHITSSTVTATAAVTDASGFHGTKRLEEAVMKSVTPSRNMTPSNPYRGRSVAEIFEQRQREHDLIMKGISLKKDIFSSGYQPPLYKTRQPDTKSETPATVTSAMEINASVKTTVPSLAASVPHRDGEPRPQQGEHWNTQPKIFRCEDCKYETKHQSNLSVHRRTHTGERPYHCGACGQRYTQGHLLKSHIRSRHGANMQFYNLDRRSDSTRGRKSLDPKLHFTFAENNMIGKHEKISAILQQASINQHRQQQHAAALAAASLFARSQGQHDNPSPTAPNINYMAAMASMNSHQASLLRPPINNLPLLKPLPPTQLPLVPSIPPRPMSLAQMFAGRDAKMAAAAAAAAVAAAASSNALSLHLPTPQPAHSHPATPVIEMRSNPITPLTPAPESEEDASTFEARRPLTATPPSTVGTTPLGPFTGVLTLARKTPPPLLTTISPLIQNETLDLSPSSRIHTPALSECDSRAMSPENCLSVTDECEHSQKLCTLRENIIRMFGIFTPELNIVDRLDCRSTQVDELLYEIIYSKEDESSVEKTSDKFKVVRSAPVFPDRFDTLMPAENQELMMQR